MERITNAFFLKLAFCNFDLWNAIPRRRIELLRQFFFRILPFSPLCAAMKILKSRFSTLCVVSQMVSHMWPQTIRHLITKISTSRFLSILIENVTGNSMRLFSGHKNDSKNNYSHFSRTYVKNIEKIFRKFQEIVGKFWSNLNFWELLRMLKDFWLILTKFSTIFI